MRDDKSGYWVRARAWVAEWRGMHSAGPYRRVGPTLGFWIDVVRQFVENRGPVRASSLAYTTLLALVPLLAISLSAAALFLPKKEEERKKQLLVWMEFAVARAAPTLGLSNEDGSDQRERVASQIVSFVERIHFKTIGAAATVGLLVVAIGLLRTVEVTFNDIWGAPRNRSLGVSIVYYWAILTLGPIVVLASKGANYLSLLDETAFARADSSVAPVLVVMSYGVFPAIMCLVFAALYWWMPNTRVPGKAALAGGATASILWTLNGKLSALYNTRILTNNAIYGSLGVLPLFLVGLYFTWGIVLFGAQVSCAFQNRAFGSARHRGTRRNPSEMEAQGLRLMTLIGTQFMDGGKPLGRDQLALVLSLPLADADELLQKLLAAEILNQVAGSDPGFCPSRPLNRISVREIIQAVCPRDDFGPSEGRLGPINRTVRRVLSQVHAASEAITGRLTLEALVNQEIDAVVPPAAPGLPG